MKPEPNDAPAAGAERRTLPARRKHGPRMYELHRRAEARLRAQRKGRQSKAGDPKAEAVRALHELEVHQIELEMQNAELQKVREELEAALEKYTELYDFAPVGYFTLAVDGKIQLVNLTGARLIGMERSRLLGRRLGLHVTADRQPVFHAFLRRVFAGETKEACEVALLSAGRPPRAVSIEAERSLNRQECRAVLVDITERKQAEEMLRQNEALFSALIQQAPVGVYVVDDQFRLQQVNPKAARVFSKIHPLHGRNFSEVIHIIWPKKLADEILEHFRHTLKTGQPYYSQNFSERRHDIGVTESYEWQIQRITLPAGSHGVVCFFNNITERKRTEATQRRLEVLAASNRKLEQEIIRREAVEKALTKSEQAQSRLLEQSRHMQEQLRFVSRQVLRTQEEERKRISRELHDVIAQTLTGINVRLATLRREAALDTKGLDRNIVRTQRLVEKSVDIVHRFARELRPTLLDDLGLIPALRAYMQSFKEETGIHVTLSTFAAVEQVKGDTRTVLYRVVQEALSNVARHAQASRVDVRIHRFADTICMRIKDNGKGFLTAKVLHAKKQERLGLLGMRERLDMVGGKFTVTSAPGKGTTVQARVPLADGLAPRRRADARVSK